MRCPVCRSTKLKIGVVFAGEVACEFRDGAVVEVLENAAIDSYWDEQSRCRCAACGWSGSVREAGQRGPVPAQADSLTSSELAAIERDLAADRCPPALKPHVERLLEAIGRLKIEAHILERVQRAQQKSGPVADGDTAIL